MTSALPDDDQHLLGRMVRSAPYQSALQSYAFGNGTGEGVAAVLLRNARFFEQRKALRTAMDALRSYQHGNGSPDLAKAIADVCELELKGTAP